MVGDESMSECEGDDRCDAVLISSCPDPAKTVTITSVCVQLAGQGRFGALIGTDEPTDKSWLLRKHRIVAHHRRTCQSR